MNFASDNVTGVAPEIFAALEAANQGDAMPYGEDAWTERLTAQFSELFETEVAVFPVATGTAANALALALLAPPYGAIYCHHEAHVAVHECGAPEFYTGGAKLVPLAGAHGKLAPETVAAQLGLPGRGIDHYVQPAALSLSQATEAGTVYLPDEVAALCEVARAHQIGVHMDGARFANAVAALGCAPADLTWRAGVDVLSFGATKNGAMAAEAAVLFRPDLARTLPYRRKRGGHLVAKMRFLAAQLAASLEGGRWLAWAGHANAAARRLAAGLEHIPGADLIHPVDANEVFVTLPEPVVAGLERDGARFHRWDSDGAPILRLVTAFDTRDDEVERLLGHARAHAAAAEEHRS